MTFDYGFDGTSGYIEINSNDFDLRQGDFTVSFDPQSINPSPVEVIWGDGMLKANPFREWDEEENTL